MKFEYVTAKGPSFRFEPESIIGERFATDFGTACLLTVTDLAGAPTFIGYVVCRQDD